MIIGTAGHIDHGKTSLVKALTGVDADRLKEEKERGITLDLGYAYHALPDGGVLGFIDVPGHEKLVHNMLAGATGIDHLLLVVAADDGIMPQTLEHLRIADLLGLHHGTVALTKTDLVTPGRCAEVRRDIEALLATTRLRDSPVLPVSCRDGSGVDALRRHLESLAQAMPAREPHGGFRLAIDRAFTLKGIGTVVTGTVFSGTVNTGDLLRLTPSGLEVRVRGIHAQNQPTEQGVAGQRCALNLTGIEKADAGRGEWAVSAFLHTPTQRLDVRLQLLPDASPLRHWAAVHLHLGSAHVTARVALLEGDTLAPGSDALAQLVLDKPVGAVAGDRCILRDASAQHTLAGAQVLDAHPPARNRRSAQRLAFLAASELDALPDRITGWLACSPNGLPLDTLAVNANIPPESLQDLLAGLPCVISQARPPATAFSLHRWQALQDKILDVLTQEHQSAPDSLGLNAEQLRMRVCPQVQRGAFAGLVESLLNAGRLARDGTWLHLPGHSIRLGAEEESLWQRIRPLLAETPEQPPRVRDLGHALGVEEGQVRDLMRRLARMARVYLVAHDHYYLPESVRRLAEVLRETAVDHPRAEVHAAEYRSRILTGRKLAIHILEFFDRIGYTRRVGDAHRIRNDLLQF